MSGWIEHDGKGVPADAKPGVTQIRLEAFPGEVFSNEKPMIEVVWGGDVILWDWARYGRPVRDASGRDGVLPRCTHYRNPSTTAAVEALKAMARNPERVRETDMPVKRKVRT